MTSTHVVRWRAPTLARDPHEPGRVASPLELFFDLVFVVAIASAAAELHHGLAQGHCGATVGFLIAFVRSGGRG